MEYRLTIQDETIPVEINSGEENTASAVIEDREYGLKYFRISDNELHLVVNGRSVNVYVSNGPDGKTIMFGGKSYRVQDADNISKGPKKKSGFDSGPSIVTPFMPAVVIAVNVKAGDQVEKGQGVVVVAAMKMETTLKAPYSGVVSKVNVSEGDKVMPGDILVDIEEIKAEESAEIEN